MATMSKFLICILIAVLLASMLCACAGSINTSNAAEVGQTALRLPDAGGIGVPVFYAGGGALILLSFIILIIQLTRKR